jgi:hypothetical protein
MARFKRKRLRDAYRFPGFVPLGTVRGVFGDPIAVVLKLSRRRKKQCAVDAVTVAEVITTAGNTACAIYPAATAGFTWPWSYGGWTVRAVVV